MQHEQTISSASVLAGLLTRAQVAAEFRKTERTVIRWEHAGLPVIKFGMTRLYDPARCREWLMSHEHQHQAPKVGRPRKHAA